MATPAPNPIQSSISADLGRELREIQNSSHTGPPGDLDDKKKRWLVIGICLHTILSPTLRKYVDSFVTNLYNSLKLSDQIDIQTQTKHLRTYGATNFYLNYEAINNNKAAHGHSSVLYDYKVQNAVDLSKLFLQTHMSHYTAFDEACDSSALLGMISKIDKFPIMVKAAANDVRSNIRNEWAHCNFTVWDDVNYVQSLQLIKNFIYLLNLNAADEKKIMEELDKWRKNGTSFLQGYTISVELVDELRQKLQVLVEYAEVISQTADTEFGKVHEALIDIGETLIQYDKRISTLENTVAVQGKALKEYESFYDSDVHEIKLWKQDSKYFIKTDIVPDILRILENKHCVLLTGVSGIGKTLTAQNIALQLEHEHQYIIVPCISLQDIPKRYKENVRQVFVVDDICGKYTANINIIENWRNITNRVTSILDKGITRILATCRTDVFKEKIVQQAFDLFHKTAYNLSDKYSVKDKLVIASKHLEHYDKMLPDITDIINKNKFSPLMCFLCSRHKNFGINEFLNSPYDTFCKEWDSLKSFDTEKYCVLLLCVIYNGTINDAIFDISNDLEKDEKRKLKDIFEWCSLNRGTSRSSIQAKMNACIDTYFIKVDREYKVIHDKMFDFLCSYFGKTLITPILKYADDKVICERVQLESLPEEHGYFTVIVSEKDEHTYIDRIKTDIVNGKIHCCLNNMQMKYKEYRIKFRDILKNLEYKLVRNLIKSKDDNGINSFISSCLRGYDELVDFFISVGADVDCQIGFFTPLTAACHDGHLKTVGILLEEGSNINYTNTQGETPLYTACYEGHYSLVNRLIDKKADINKQNNFNRTPLHASCMLGHATIVSLLIDKGANVFQYEDLLIAATIGGNDKIVERLLSKGCCLNGVDVEGKTALFIACEEAYTKIVKLLIDNNADIYKVDSNGINPMHAACCAGNNDIVSLFISKDSDLNMIDVDLETPLHKACRKGSADVIQNLLAFGADINKANKDAHTPAHIARTEGGIMDEHILKSLEKNEIVSTEKQTLAQNNKNEFIINSLEYGWTPLYEACVNGDIETVQSLIRNRANVNMKTDSGEMPLVAVCQQGHGFLIQLLLDKGADVNEALWCAIRKGYNRTIKMLLYKGGNVGYKGGNVGYKGVAGTSLLTEACKQRSVNEIKLLLGKGADFKQMGFDWNMLLTHARNADIIDILQCLIRMGLNINMHDKNGNFPLFVSLDKGYDDISRFLIAKRCPIATSKKGIETALISTFESGNMELSNLLVSDGYMKNVSLCNESVLYHAYRLGLCQHVLKYQRRHGPEIKEKYKYGYTPMILADIGGKDDVSEYLQQSMCSIRNSSTSNNMIALRVGATNEFATDSCLSLKEYEYLFQALMNGDIKSSLFEILDNRPKYHFNFFIEKGEPNVSIWFEQTPLCLAIRRGHTEVVKFLIKHGVDVNLTFEELSVKDDVSLSLTIRYGYTPLFAACQRKYYEIVDMLLERGANLNKALYDACREGYLDTVQFLLQKGADVNSMGRHSLTALYGACIGGYSAIVKFLIHQGAYVNKLDHYGRSSLHYSCKERNYRIVEILIDKGGEVNASDREGITPLMACFLENEEDDHLGFTKLYEHCPHPWSASMLLELKNKLLTENYYQLIQLLIDNGADIYKNDWHGETPLSFARKIGDYRLLKIMLN